MSAEFWNAGEMSLAPREFPSAEVFLSRSTGVGLCVLHPPVMREGGVKEGGGRGLHPGSRTRRPSNGCFIFFFRFEMRHIGMAVSQVGLSFLPRPE